MLEQTEDMCVLDNTRGEIFSDRPDLGTFEITFISHTHLMFYAAYRCLTMGKTGSLLEYLAAANQLCLLVNVRFGMVCKLTLSFSPQKIFPI